MLSPNWLLILAIIVLLILGTSVFLYLVLKRARKISFSPDPKAKPESDEQRSPPLEFLQHASDIGLRSSFRRALRILRTHVTGRDFRYQVPWFLMAGEADSGKTTLLESSGLELSVSEPAHGDEQLNWYFFNEGLVIDASGDFVLRANGTADHRGWNTISRLLQKHRPQRPLDGVVLTIPATDLVGGANGFGHESSRRLEQKATCLYQKLWQAQKILGMCLPVYVLVTKCDEVPGFASFSEQLPEGLQTQMLGWSNPSTLQTAYNPELVPEAFDSLHRSISRLQFEIYTERDEIQNADELFLFPPAMQSMRAPLQVYLDCLFKESAYHESYFFRGVYFCGEGVVESSLEIAAQPESRPAWDYKFEPFRASLPQEIPARARKPIFLTDLFKEKIFCEAALAQPIKRAALSRNRLVLTAQALSLVILLLGFGGIAATYPGLARREAALYGFLAAEKTDLETLKNSYVKSNRQPADMSYRPATYRGAPDGKVGDLQHPADTSDGPGTIAQAADAERTTLRQQALLSGEARLLAGMAVTNGNSFWGVFIPSSWFSSINERMENSIVGAFEFIVFESLRIDLERRGHQLLDTDFSPGLSANSSYGQSAQQGNPLGVADQSSPGLEESFQLHLYIEELGELRVNLERYDRLIRKDYSSSDDLRQLVKYLGHAPLPDGFDKENELFERALREAEGKPIETKWFYKECAGRVAEIVEDIYESSFRRDVKYDYLKDIAETEALLNRPEYTWLSTFVVDAHSPSFPGLTISSALSELKEALRDLRGEELRSREVAPDSTPRYQHAVPRVLIWDQEILHQAIALYDEYETFVEARSYGRSESLTGSVKQVARARVKARMRNLLARARKYQPLAAPIEGSAIRSSLIIGIGNLQEAQEPLSRVLEISTRLGVDGELRAALSGQAEYLLRGIDREFVAQRFYIPKETKFSWWDGRQPVSYRVYDLGSSEELPAYLTLQRKGIAFLGRDLVVPVVSSFAALRIYVPRRNSQVNWDQLLTDLDAYDNKLPGNPIAALETFIRTDMNSVSVGSCAGTSPLSDDGSSDYFLSIRNSLREGFYARCRFLALRKAIDESVAALANYRKIEESFNQNLAGGFPFAYVSDQPTQPQLDPWAMIKFFTDLEGREKAAREALDRSREFGASPERALEFLDQVDKVREFFAPFLEKKQGPVYEFRVQFRVNREPESWPEREIGGNQIIDWKLEVGKKTFSSLSDDLTGQWIIGEPIRLTLRWAKDSPRMPVAGATPARVAIKDRSAVFEYVDRWSLLTFLLKHGRLLKRAGPAVDCDQGTDAAPYTLKFTIRTEPDPLAVPAQTPDLRPTEVFMRVSLVTANKQEPLMLPCFPTKAPPVPSLFTYSTNKVD